MTDMLMCLTVLARRVRERRRDGGEQTDSEEGRREKKMLMLFNSLPHRHWQQDLCRHSDDRCMVMKPALGEIRRRLFLTHSQSPTFCLTFLALLFLMSHTHQSLHPHRRKEHAGVTERKVREKKRGNIEMVE